MDGILLRIAGDEPSGLAARLSIALGEGWELPALVNADLPPDATTIAARCTAFAGALPAATEGLIITLLHAAPPGLGAFQAHAANAALWAFTRLAALEWAPRRIRVNAIGLGANPAGPFDAIEQSGRAASPTQAAPAGVHDIVRTIRAIAAWPSMTGQIIRLGA